MALTINTNIASLTAQKNLATTQTALQQSIQRLSSGLRINNASDDAAGLAIASRFTAQINGVNQAVLNSNDGSSLAQTADSALASVADNLQRIRTLAVQSANGGAQDTTAQADADTEFKQLGAERFAHKRLVAPRPADQRSARNRQAHAGAQLRALAAVRVAARGRPCRRWWPVWHRRRSR